MNFYPNLLRIRVIPSGDEYRYCGGYDMQNTVNDRERFAGNFGTKESNNSLYTLFTLEEYDANWIANNCALKLKENERVFRYETETTKAGRISPFVKVNLKSGLIYFNAGNTDEDEVIFDTRSTCPTFMNLCTSIFPV